MPVRTLPATEVLHRLGEFDAVIDARSEDEHALDHVRRRGHEDDIEPRAVLGRETCCGSGEHRQR